MLYRPTSSLFVNLVPNPAMEWRLTLPSLGHSLLGNGFPPQSPFQT